MLPRKSHFTFNNVSFFENRAVCEIMWENVAQPDMPQIAIY